MKEVEKLDLILFSLYESHRSYLDIGNLLKNKGVELDNIELWRLGDELKDLGFIKGERMDGGYIAILTSKGAQYCENSSFSKEGQSIIQLHINIDIQVINILQQAGFSEQEAQKITSILKQSKDEERESKLKDYLKDLSKDVLANVISSIISSPSSVANFFQNL